MTPRGLAFVNQWYCTGGSVIASDSLVVMSDGRVVMSVGVTLLSRESAGESAGSSVDPASCGVTTHDYIVEPGGRQCHLWIGDPKFCLPHGFANPCPLTTALIQVPTGKSEDLSIVSVLLRRSMLRCPQLPTGVR